MKKPIRIQWGLWILVVLINAFACGVAAWLLEQNRANYQGDAQREALNLGRMMEQSLADTIDKIEMNLHAVVDEVYRQKINGGLNDEALSAFLARHQARFPEMGSMRVVNAQGVITHGIGRRMVAGADVRDREYFRFLRDHADAGTYISRPFIGRTSNEWVLVFSQRINNPDGSFGGVVNGTIELEHLKWIFSQLNLSRNGTITLRDEEGGLIVRYPSSGMEGHEVGQKIVSTPLETFIRDRKQYGIYMSTSPVDGIERVNAIRKVGEYPLYLIVGLAAEDYLSAWRHEVIVAGTMLAVLLLITVVMGMQLNVNWFKRLDLIEQLDRNQKRFQSLATMSSDWFWEQDENFRFVDVGDDVSRKYGKSAENFAGKTRWDFGMDKRQEEWDAHRAVLAAHQPFYDFEYCFIDDAGERRCISVSGEPVFDADERFTGYRGVGRDITERKRYEERIAQMAQYDGLTNLPNRALFYDRLNHAISMAKREQREFALLYFDLDKFKPVNDRYGHGAGDQLLQTVASRMRYLLRESDTVARLGGDEFTVLLPSIADRRDAEEVAQRILSALTSPYTLEGVEEKVCIGVSIGIALYPRDGKSGDDLVRSADAAMYKSKGAGGCCYGFAEGTSGVQAGLFREA